MIVQQIYLIHIQNATVGIRQNTGVKFLFSVLNGFFQIQAIRLTRGSQGVSK